MTAIVEEIIIKASPQRVWNALTQQDEVLRWWADKARLKLEVGSLAEFCFKPPAGTLQFEVVGLEQDKNVYWISKAPPLWAGTSVTWQLTPIHNGTLLVFTHEGFTQVDRGYERARENWRYFLGSLKSYMETGRGTPGFPASLS